jgi:hypothetical protein
MGPAEEATPTQKATDNINQIHLQVDRIIMIYLDSNVDGNV